MQSTPQVPVAEAKGSRFAFGCVLLFMLPFFLAGLGVTVAAVNRPERGMPFYMQLVFGGTFMLVAVVMGTAAFFGMRSSAATAARRAAHPDSPWMWREDWAQRTSKERSAALGFGLLIFGVIWTLISSLVVLPVKAEFEKGNHIAIIGLIFPVIGAFLLLGAVYQIVKRLKYGAPPMQLDSIPIEPGRTFRGTVPARLSQVPDAGIDVRLTLVNRIVTGSGKNSSTREEVKWADETKVERGAAMPSMLGLMLPVSFAIPHNAHPTDDSDSRNSWAWRLRLSADVPGVDYAAEYELPVFRTPGWEEREEEVQEQEAEARHAYEARLESMTWTPKASSGVTLSHTPSGGERIHIRRGSFSWGGVIFLLVWSGIVYAMIRFGAPIGFPIVFGLIWLLGLLGVLDAALGWVALEPNRTQLLVQRSFCGFKSSKLLIPEDIETIQAEVGGTGNASSNIPLKYDVKVKRNDGTTTTLVSMMDDKNDAEMLAARLRKAMAISSSRASAAD
jgi:hypothetical protein